MTEHDARAIFEARLRAIEARGCPPLVEVPGYTHRIAQGWAFVYQSKAYVEDGVDDAMLIGQGPAIVMDDGRLVEGGSRHGTPEEVLRDHGLLP
jgi:hypothetical protein